MIYKLTDHKNRTKYNTAWGPGVTHTADGYSTELCNEHFVHAYADPYLAVLMNPVHANIKNPKLWECEGVVKIEQPDKLGCTSLTTLREIPLPVITTAKCRKFALLCTMEVYPLRQIYDIDGVWLEWSKIRDKTRAARAAEAAARAAAWADNKINLVKLAQEACKEAK